MNALGRCTSLTNLPFRISTKQVHTNANILDNCTNVTNRNPRNLELLRIARKPTGYQLDLPGHMYWHKLIITKSNRHITVEVLHHENGSVFSTSTKEWCIRKHLYNLQDSASYKNLGRIMARRCVESGIFKVRCDIKPAKGEKEDLLLKELKNYGIWLIEPPRYKHLTPSDNFRHEKPWEVHE